MHLHAQILPRRRVQAWTRVEEERGILLRLPSSAFPLTHADVLRWISSLLRIYTKLRPIHAHFPLFHASWRREVT